jgi:hypothetical protein
MWFSSGWIFFENLTAKALLPNSWVFFPMEFSSPFTEKSFLLFFHLFSSVALMKTNCEACNQPFIPSPNNRAHQRFCPDVACQRVRRNQTQSRRRRSQAGEGCLWPSSTMAKHQHHVAPEAVVKPAEAGLSQFHPLIIGLVSTMIDSIDPDDILTCIQRCYIRGVNLCQASRCPKQVKPLKYRQNSASARSKAA